MRSGGVATAAAILAGAATVINAAVPVTEMYPMIDFYHANDHRAHPFCEPPSNDDQPSVPIQPIKIKARTWPHRPSVGLRQLTTELMELYKDSFANRSLSDIKYVAQARRKKFNWSGVKTNSLSTTLGNAMMGRPASVADAMCDSFDAAVKDEYFCYAVGNFSMRTSCLQQYEYEDPSAVLSAMREWEATWPTASECYQGITPAHNPLEFQLQSLMTVPAEIDTTTAYSESRSYFAAWRAIEKFERYCESKFLTLELGKVQPLRETLVDNDIFDEVLPGWKTERVWYAHELWAEDKPYYRIPFAMLARKEGTRHLLFVVRRPLTNYESRSAWENQQTGEFLFDFPGAIHDGSGTYRGQLHPTFMRYIREWMKEVKAGENPDADSITLVGADFPGTGVAIGLGANIAQMRARVLGLFSRTKVNVITFGNPYYGNREFTDYVHSNVNARHIQIEADATYPFPCPTNRACDERHLITRTGAISGTKTYNTRAPGYFRIPLSDLGKMNSTWAKPEAALQLAAIRDCGYACGLGYRACKADPWVQHNCNECESWVNI